MVTFYVTAKRGGVEKFFADMIARGEEARDKLKGKLKEGYINPSCLWFYERKKDKYKIIYLGFPIGKRIFFWIFSMNLKKRYDTVCKRIKESDYVDG